MLLPKKRRKKN